MIKDESIKNNPLVSLGLIKDKVGKILMQNDDVVSLVMPELDNEDFSFEDNWFGCSIGKNLNGDIQDTRIIGHCSNTPYFDETITDTRAMIMMETYLGLNPSVYDYSLVINVVVHKDFVELDPCDQKVWKAKGYAGNRVDMICMSIYNALTSDDIVNNFGIGKMDLDYRSAQMQSFKPNTSFYGRTMKFRIDEVNSKVGV